MLELILAITAFGLLAAEIALLAALAALMMRRRDDRRPPAQAGGETEAGTPTPEKPKPGSVDEGFENIMQYAVKGRNGLDADERR